MKKTKIFKKLILLISVTIFCTIGAKAETIDNIIKRGELRVGLSSFVPWAFVNKNGELVGFEVDVAKKLAKDLGVKVKIINMYIEINKNIYLEHKILPY